MFRFLLIVVMMVLVAACGAEPTPFPVDVIPEVTETPIPQTDTTVIRYALASNTLDAVPDLELIRESAQIEQLNEAIQPGDLGNRYDIVVAYGDLPDGTRAAAAPTIALVLPTTSPPLNNPVLQNILRRSINPAQLVSGLNMPGALAQPVEITQRQTLQAELANEGWPDGFSLTLGNAYAPGSLLIAEQLGELRINLHTLMMPVSELSETLTTGDVQLGLIAWTTPEERQQWTAEFGEENVIDLFSVSISYHAIPDLNISFTPAGWPLAAR
ncbi:MAG: hypothetical protein K8L97_30300 [Anaerolineae bacterium]|nr:hypothetical protein [Anaerolineae bacterium]